MNARLIAAAALLATLSAARAQTAPADRSPDIRDWRYVLTIHEIAKADDDERLARLLADNPDRARSRQPDGRTPVHAAAEAGALKSLRALKQVNADMNVLDSKNRSPLSIALGLDFLTTARTLVDMGADANLEASPDGNIRPEPPLTTAIRHGNVELINVLLAGKANLNRRASDGTTPLTVASAAGQWDVVALLLDKGADVNTADNSGVTALLHAAEAGDEKRVALLLNKGADPRLADRAGRTPMALTESPPIWRLLADKGADVNVMVGNQSRLQHYIAQGNVSHVTAWLAYKPDPFLTDRQGRTAKELARKAAEGLPATSTEGLARREIVRLLDAYQSQYLADLQARETPATAPASRPATRAN